MVSAARMTSSAVPRFSALVASLAPFCIPGNGSQHTVSARAWETMLEVLLTDLELAVVAGALQAVQQLLGELSIGQGPSSLGSSHCIRWIGRWRGDMDCCRRLEGASEMGDKGLVRGVESARCCGGVAFLGLEARKIHTGNSKWKFPGFLAGARPVQNKRAEVNLV